MSELIAHAPLCTADRDALRAATAKLDTLEQVLAWSMTLPGQPVVSAIIVQDEYTHDVVLPWRNGMVLVFDTT